MGERLYYVLQIIKAARGPISAKDIQKKLLIYNICIDIKTVYESIHRINEFYYLFTDKLYIKAIRKKGYCIENDYFDDGQLQYLLDSILFNPNLSTAEINKLKDSLLSLSSATQQARLMFSDRQENDQNFSLLLNLTTLLKAITNKQNIYFEYVSYKVDSNSLLEIASSNGNFKQGNHCYYVVSPYQIILRGSNYYLVGYFDKRSEQLSMYRVDRMRVIRHHSSKFVEIREKFDMVQELQKNVNMFISDSHIHLTFKFKDSILREVVNQFGTNFEVTKTIDGWNKAVVKDVSLSEGLIGWILMLHDQIEIIAPEDVRESILHKIENMYTLYK